MSTTRGRLAGLRVAVIDPAYVGDVVFLAPLTAALAEAGASLGVVVRPVGAPVAERLPGRPAVHVFDKRGVDRGLAGLRRSARALQTAAYDVALIPHRSIRSAFLAQWAAIPRRIGLSPGGSKWLYTGTETVGSAPRFLSDRLALARALGVSIDPRPDVLGSLARRRGRAEGRGLRVGLCLGAQWATKRWPPHRAAEAIRVLEHEFGSVTWVLLGSEAERPLFDALLTIHRPTNTVDAIGGSIENLIDALEDLDAVIGGDTGPVHVARGLGVPALILCGPTDPAPLELGGSSIALRLGLDCQPCSRHGSERCPLVHHRCLRDLSGRTVAEAMMRLLGQRP